VRGVKSVTFAFGKEWSWMGMGMGMDDHDHVEERIPGFLCVGLRL
jgi:hypothetical protein